MRADRTRRRPASSAPATTHDLLESIVAFGLAAIVFLFAVTAGSGWLVIFAGVVLLATLLDLCASVVRWLS